MHARKRTTTTVAVTLLAISLGACSSSGSGSASDAAKGQAPVDRSKWPAPVPTSGLVKGLTLPLEAYLPSHAHTVAVDQARTNLQEQCMAEYGLTVSLSQAGATPALSDNDMNIERRYGITDRALAEKYGYQFTPEQQKLTEDKTPDLSGIEVEVLTGRTKPEPAAAPSEGAGSYFATPDQSKPARAEHNGKKLRAGGCVGWSRTKIAPASDLSGFATRLASQSLSAARAEPEVQRALKMWSGCMKKAGYDVAQPSEAMDEGLSKDAGTTAPKAQINVALADVDCKKETDLVKVWSGAEAAVQKKLIKENQAQLTEDKKALDALVKAARTQQTK